VGPVAAWRCARGYRQRGVTSLCVWRRVAGGTLVFDPTGDSFASTNNFVVTVYGNQVQAEVHQNGDVCHIDVTAVSQEVGQHGVTGFKYRSRIFSGSINEYTPDILGSIFRDSGWNYTKTFSDDERSMQFTWRNVHPFVMIGDTYVVRMRVVAIRPSWWKHDYGVTLNPGACSLSAAAIFP
jgi:hypothetical protein